MLRYTCENILWVNNMKAVIFDMDGVIFDSERAVYALWRDMAEKYGFEDIETPYFKSIGTNKEVTKRIFLEFYGEDFPYDEYKKEQSENYHRKYDGGRLPLKAGIFELLEFLKSWGLFTAVASSTRSEVVLNQIKDAGLAKYFDRIIGGDMVTKSKPEPDIFLKAAEGLEFEEIYVIEDSFNGIRAAKKAGMIPVMVPDMIPPDDEMREKAKVILPDLLAVLDYLRGEL